MSQKTYTSNMANVDPLDNNKQFVISRSNILLDFTDDEFQACSDAMSNGFSVVIHYASGGLNEATLAKINSDGSLVFTKNTADGRLIVYTVAAAGTHSVTAATFDIADSITPVSNTGIKVADIKLNGVDTELYAPSPFYFVDTSTDTRSSIADAFDDGLIPVIKDKNPAGLRELYFFTHGAPSAGYSFAYTDSSGTHGYAINEHDTWTTF